MDVDRCPSLVARLGIVMIPTLIVFVQGVERLRLRGVVRLDELIAAMGGFLGGRFSPAASNMERPPAGTNWNGVKQ